MDRDAVIEYVGRCQQLIESSLRMDEENSKVKLVHPFLRLLGWDLYSTEVVLEYTVPMASGSTHVDYALLVGETPVMFVEVKPVRTALTDENVQQLRSYMRQELDVDWGLLTNGKSFEVLTKVPSKSSGEEVSVVQFGLGDLPENPGVLELLSKESIRSGQSDEIAEQVAQTNRAIRHFQENEGDVTESIVETVEMEVGTLTIDLEEQTREFVQRLISVLQEQRQFVNQEPAISSSGESRVPNITNQSEPIEDHVNGTIARTGIDGDPSSNVAVFPAKESGLPLLKENEAWGFARIGREFDYVAMYITGDVRAVKYFATVDAVMTPEAAPLMREPSDYVDQDEIADDKMVVVFEKGSLYELETPIPYENKYPQSLRYTTLGDVQDAETTDDLF
ncbi:type I restriction enzyme HsdR N-terminal domain-containing protein [Halocatena pleomorpha]|uniref:Type I restriction enzyme R protein N-terminal domain-containing protein n=1 Tax=Halocatena pleomorpha TaxID=1785090 RepID=A0A3P3RIT9_9EURY|nr:type I restriction enzyme HsdR N-terminal domain-containing protein [Halocatena pleomorpha]RRJ33456.1 hypothetical protein EIK79_01220 [Halocatena pleomorpha]